MKEYLVFRKKDTKEQKKTVIITYIKIMMSVLLAIFLLFTATHFGTYQKETLVQTTSSGVRELFMLEDNTYVTQVFKAKFNSLNEIYVYFANDYEGQCGGKVVFMLRDENAKIVQETKLDAKDIKNKEFTKIKLKQKLQAGKKYHIIFTGEGLEKGKAPIIYRARRSPLFANKALVAGVEQKTALKISYYYPGQLLLGTWGIMLLIAGLYILMWYPVKKGKILAKIKQHKIVRNVGNCIPHLMFFLTPCLSFWMMEHFTGNAVQDIYTAGVIFSLVIYYILFGVLFLIINRPRVTIALYMLLCYIMGAANYFVLMFRGTPILPTDIKSLGTALNVSDNFTYTLNTAFVINAIIMLYWCIFFSRYTTRQWKLEVKPRLCLAVVQIACIVAVTGLVEEETMLKSVDVKADIWNQKRGYSRNGTLAGFCLNAKYLHTKKPEGYSVEKVEEIAASYLGGETETASLNGMSTKGNETKSSKKPNIILIMNEAFSDLSVINDIKTNEKYMPFISSMKKNTVKGNMYVSIFGSGTCNTEFEVLTGNSMAFLPSGSIGYTQYVKDKMPSFTWNLKAQGYKKATALHPYLADGWNRPTVYPNLGFDRFLSQDDFKNPKLVRKYISDESDYDKIISLYKKSKRKNSDPFYLFTVTMQNHAGFTNDYGNLDENVQILDEKKDPQAEQYLSLIKESDKAYKKLINYFAKQTDPTVVIMFGDHQPALSDDFYEKLYGKSLDSLTLDELEKKYTVPFIIWSNFDMQEDYVEAISANYFSSYVSNLLGLEMTPYQEYLLHLYDKIPVINSIGYKGDDGKFYEFGDESPYKEYIQNYQILQYNNVIDTQHRYNKFFEIATEEPKEKKG